MNIAFVTGGPRSGKSFSLAAKLGEVLGPQFTNPSDGVAFPGVGVWISAHRFSADAITADLAQSFHTLIGRVRITTPVGLAHAVLRAMQANPASNPSDLVSGAAVVASALHRVLEVSRVLEAREVWGSDRPVSLDAVLGWGAQVVCDDVDCWSADEQLLVETLLALSTTSGAKLVGVSADRLGQHFGEVVRIWPGLNRVDRSSKSLAGLAPDSKTAPLLRPSVPLLRPSVPRQTRVVGIHRSLAPEAVVQVLLEACREGIAWHELAVVVRNRGFAAFDHGAEPEFLGALSRSGRRSGLRFVEPGRHAGADPIVRQWLRQTDRELASQNDQQQRSLGQPKFLYDVLFRGWENEFARLALASGSQTIAACNAVLRNVGEVALSNIAACQVELRRVLAASWVNTASTIHQTPIEDGSCVAILTPSELIGRQFAVIVVVGLAEGSWPSTARKPRTTHDPADEITNGIANDGAYGVADDCAHRVEQPGGTAESDRAFVGVKQTVLVHELDEERAAQARHVAMEELLFRRCIARATTSVVAIATPEPGVLVSRFIEDWPNHTYAYPNVRRATVLPTLRETPGVVPCFPDGRLRLSASQLSTFENCPQNFAYQYVAAVRGSGSVQASVGTMVHEALERYLTTSSNPVELTPPPEQTGLSTDRQTGQIRQTGLTGLTGLTGNAETGASKEKRTNVPLIPYSPGKCGLPELLTCLDEAWDSTAFAYRPQEADYRRRAEDWLRIWWENELPKIAQVVAVEHRFTINVGEDSEHVLIGSIDRVSIDPNGNLEIVDYKTGTPPAGLIDEEDLQLATYHLAVNNDPAFAGVGAPDRLRLHFLQNGKDIDQPITPDHAEKTSARIAFRANEILGETFRPSIDADCQYCAFQRACPIQPLGAEVGS